MRVYTLGRYPHFTLKEGRAEAAGMVAERGDARVRVADAVEEFMDVRIRPQYKRTANAEVYARAIAASLGSSRLTTCGR
jgi:hypothetical protein